MPRHGLPLSLIVVTLACREPAPVPAPPPPPPAEPAPASVMGVIVATNVTWGDALVRGDSATLRSVYTPDAVLMASDGDVNGADAIVSRLLATRRAIRDSVHGTATTTDRLDVAGDKAYEAGTITYTVLSQGGPHEVKARYVNFWQLTAGHWQLSRSFRPLP